MTAVDPSGLSATQSVGVTVETPNRAPVPAGSIPAQSVTAGQTVRLDVASYFSDPDGNALVYDAATSAPGVASVSMSGSSLAIVGVSAGTATVNVTATDPDGLSAAQGFDVTVQRPNRPPTVAGSIPAQTVQAGRTATVDVTSYFSDPDGDALQYSAATSNARIVTVDVSGSTVSFTGVARGNAVVAVTATDPGGLTVTQSVHVTVQAANNAPVPVGSIPAESLDAGRSVRIDLAPYFRDPDGDRLRYAAEAANDGLVSPTIFQSRLTIVGVSGGSTVVTVTATDPRGLTGTQTLEVTVRGRRGGFRDDFETPESLNGWNIRNASAVVPLAPPADSGALHLTNRVTGSPGYAERRSAPSLRAWELSTAISRDTGAVANPGVVWFTAHDRFSAVRLLLPTPATSRDRNYEFAVFDGGQNGWLAVTELSARSAHIAAVPGTYDGIRLAHDGTGFFVFEAGSGNAVFRVDLNATIAGVRLGDFLDHVTGIRLVNAGALDATAIFDEVEMSGEEISADIANGTDTPHDIDRVRANAAARAAGQVRLEGAGGRRNREPR